MDSTTYCELCRHWFIGDKGGRRAEACKAQGLPKYTRSLGFKFFELLAEGIYRECEIAEYAVYSDDVSAFQPTPHQAAYWVKVEGSSNLRFIKQVDLENGLKSAKGRYGLERPAASAVPVTKEA